MLCFVFAVLVALLDQFIKRWVLLTIAVNESRELLPGIIGLTNVSNPGAAFSILAGQRWLLAGIAFLAVLLLVAILLRYNEGFWGTLGLSAVLGGTIGNLIDRVAYGYVVDMFNLQFMDFAIFNIADIFITLGGITFLIHFIVTSIKPEKSKKTVIGDATAYEYPAEIQEDEHQIGSYDFHYSDEPSGGDMPEYDGISDSQSSPGLQAESTHDPSPDEQAPVQDEMAQEAPVDYSPAIEVLSELENELREAGALEDYDLDELLREYGFEDNSDNE